MARDAPCELGDRLAIAPAVLVGPQLVGEELLLLVILVLGRLLPALFQAAVEQAHEAAGDQVARHGRLVPK